jgi:hypothetical protein
MEYKSTNSATGVRYYKKTRLGKWQRIPAKNVPDSTLASKSPTKVKRTKSPTKFTGDELPPDVIRTILTFGMPDDVLNVCFSSKAWKARCKTDEFWNLYLKDKNQTEYNAFLLDLSLMDNPAAAAIFSLLWTHNYKGIEGPFIKERYIMIDSLRNAYKMDNNVLATLLKGFGKGWKYYRWEAILDSEKLLKIERITTDFIKANSITALIVYLKKNKIDLNDVSDIFGTYLDLETLVRIYKQVYKMTKEELLDDPNYEILPHALEHGNLELVKSLDNGNVPWDGMGLWGISSKDASTIYYTLHKLGLTDFNDVTPNLLGEFVG